MIPSQRERAAFFAAACQHVVESSLHDADQHAPHDADQHTLHDADQHTLHDADGQQAGKGRDEEWMRRYCDLLALHSSGLGSPLIE